MRVKKAAKSYIGMIVAVVIFVLCSFWIYKNVKIDEILGQNTDTITEEIRESENNHEEIVED